VLGQRIVDFDEVSDIMDRPRPTAERLVAALVQDGLIRVEGRNIML
jgi:predicted transcriptional regulator